MNAEPPHSGISTAWRDRSEACKIMSLVSMSHWPERDCGCDLSIKCSSIIEVCDDCSTDGGSRSIIPRDRQRTCCAMGKCRNSQYLDRNLFVRNSDLILVLAIGHIGDINFCATEGK